MQQRCDSFMNKLFKRRLRNSNKLTALLDVSMFDE